MERQKVIAGNQARKIRYVYLKTLMPRPNGAYRYDNIITSSLDSTVTKATSSTTDMNRLHGGRIGCNVYN
jgi:hypothetical protein